MSLTPEQGRESLIAAKKKLIEGLGSIENEKMYWANMKAWFKNRLTKEEFDMECRQLLPKASTHLHNEFLLAVLTKCHSVGGTQASKDASAILSLRAKRNKRKLHATKRKFETRFSPTSPIQLPPTRNLLVENKQLASKRPAKAKEQRFPKNLVLCAKSLEIPSMVEMNGRVGVVAWENGLDDFSEDVSQYLIKAIHVFLKNIITGVCAQRSCYKIHGKDFKHHMGCTARNPYALADVNLPSLFGKKSKDTFSNSNRPTYDQAEQIAIECMGHAVQRTPPPRPPANMYDLLLALKKDKFLISSHSVYSTAIARIIEGLWHPDHDEIEQDQEFARITSNQITAYG